MTPLLELVDLNVRYGGISAVRGLSLSVEPRRDRRADRPERRRQVDDAARDHGHRAGARGRDPARRRIRAGQAPEVVARAGIALVPEGRRIFAELTVEENLRLGLAGRRAQEGGDEDIEAVYALFPIVKEFRRRQAGALSGGQQQQLAIGRALVARPRAAPARRALARARAEDRRRRLRGARRDPRARHHGAARRAAGAAHGRARRPHVPDGERRGAADLTPADADDTEKMVAAYLS